MNLTSQTFRGNLLALIGAAPVSLIVTHATAQCQVAEVAGLNEDGDDFGRSVAISGDVAVVGDPGVIGAVGAAYVFRRGPNGPGDWQLDTVLESPELDPDERFGRAVAVTGSVLVVGAPNADSPAFQQGAAYVYRFDGIQWQFQAMLTASDGESDDVFGQSVAIDGDVLVIGAPNVVVNGLAHAGAAYIYRFNEKKGEWIEQAKLTAPNAEEEDGLGLSVSIRGDVALVGAPGKNHVWNESGSAFVFRRKGSEWSYEAELADFDDIWVQWLGFSVYLSQDIAVVGVPLDNSIDKGNDSGSAYIYRYDPDTSEWAQEQTIIASDAAHLDWFGFSVSISEDGQTIASGAVLDDDLGSGSGSAYVFRLFDGKWQETAKVTASNGGPGDNFGGSVALSQDMLLVGSHRASQLPGGAYLYAGLSDLDCNNNGEPDSCDIFDHTSEDRNANGIPDECENPADLDGDGSVGVGDLLILLGNWGPCRSCDDCQADLNGDCVVGVADFLILLANWG